MPVVIRQLVDGNLIPVEYTASSLGDAAQHEPDEGVYTVANTENTYDVVQLSAHLARLRDSAEREGIAFTLEDDVLRRALRDVIDLSGYEEVKFRVTIPKQRPDVPIISVEPFGGYPPSLYDEGVAVAVAHNSARLNPAAKDTAWMRQREVLRARTDAYEVILTDADGYLLEGTGSNFYAVQDGTLYTALDGVLGGTSRGIVFEVAPAILPLVKQPLKAGDSLDEAFITSSSRGVVPVVQIDDSVLGDGTPGPFTRRIGAAYRAWMAEHLETL